MSQSSDPTTYDPVAAGFKSGLEVHQQLLTDHKLFCRCPAGLYSDEYDAEALRHMRPTLSELGEYDGTALMEFKTRKEILYRLNRRSVCTYEMDDNPPFPINSQAVDIAIEIALLFNCKIVGELHVARKQYLDGSIPAGFQRTAIVGLNGGFEFQGRTIGVVQLAVEEDSCREILDRGHRRICATDRLSMPLIEVVTAPDIRTPEEVALVGTLIGDIVRSTGKVRRGIGSVRQDVNVSVAGGTRIEIKGVPRIPLFPSLTYYEAYRQSRLLALRERMRARGIDRLPRLFRRVDAGGRLVHPQVIAAVARGERVGATIATGMAGLLRWPIGPTRTFADDIAGRVRVIACLTEPPYILHTDDRRPTSLSRRDRETLKALGDMSEDDAAIVVHGQDADIDTALDEI
ncbi:MAG: Glu-tRNA(Gln) amidotransferase GatDE subunit E, partial [Calditrichaeota bacterium]|nr:Glu-tRNA(Gln) amidotransferase GatDE subunit E [Calditrichota bacterium]